MRIDQFISLCLSHPLARTSRRTKKLHEQETFQSERRNSVGSEICNDQVVSAIDWASDLGDQA